MSSATATARRPFAHDHAPRMLIDVAIAIVACSVTIAQLSHAGSTAFQAGTRGFDSGGALLALGSTVPLLVWRSAPRAVFALTVAVSAIGAAAGYALALPVGASVALYLLVAGRDNTDPRRRGPASGALLGLGVYLAGAAVGNGGLPGGQLLHAGLAWAVAWFAGERTRLLHEHLVQLHERAERADRDAERDRRLAAAEERTRIARDLHDSVGHAINVITVRAGAARLRHADDPERSLIALQEIEDVARSSAQDIDQIVATLRDPPARRDAPAAPIGLASLATLVEHHALGGLVIHTQTTGDQQRLAHAVDQAAYRIVQEALTNAARYGVGSVDLKLAYADTALLVTVTNPVPDGRTKPTRGGHGLIGMRERAALTGGTLYAQRVNGSFHVRAQLPYAAPPA